MNNKIVKLIIIFSIIILGLSYKVYGVENLEESQTLPPTEKSEVFTLDNFYEYNEELHKQNTIKKQTYYSNVNDISLKEYIIQQIKTCPEAINISSYQVLLDDAESVLLPTLYYDEMFCINGLSWDFEWLDYDYTTGTGTLIVKNLYYEYILTADEVEQAWNEIENEVARYKRGIKSEWSELEKVLYTNNFLCHTCEYASSIVNSSHTLYGALVTKLPVCDGYSHAVRYLLNQIGMEADIATSTSMNHAWNLVKIDGEYYHIDVTWNDSYLNGTPGVGKTSYEFFLASGTSFQNERKESHSGWVADYEATSTRFDGNQPWRNQNNYLIYKDDYWYYIKNNGNSYDIGLYKLNLRNNEVQDQQVKTNNTQDYVFANSGLTTDGNNLYYSTEYKIFKMDFNGENLEQFYEQTDTSKCIYSVEIIKDVFYYDTLDIKLVETEGGSYNTISPETRVTHICSAYEPEEVLIYTTLDTILQNEKELMVFDSSQLISDFLTSKNFPIIDKNYIIEIRDKNNKVKSNESKIGSENIIKIYNILDVLVKEYTIIVKGDVNGDGRVAMYDAFVILKENLFSKNTSFDEIDILIRDYNGDGNVTMYDAFAFLKKSIFTN